MQINICAVPFYFVFIFSPFENLCSFGLEHYIKFAPEMQDNNIQFKGGNSNADFLLRHQ